MTTHPQPLESWITTARESRTPSEHEREEALPVRKHKLRSWKTAAVLTVALAARRGLGNDVARRVACQARQGRDHDRLQGRVRVRLRAGHRRGTGCVREVRRWQGEEQEQAVGRNDRHQRRRHADQDRRLRLRQRHRAGRRHRDEAPDGEAGRRRHDRAAVGRRGRVRGELRQGPPDQDVHHRHRRVAGSDDADRAEEPVPLPRRRRPVERGHRRDRLQEARLAQGRDHRWTTTASAGRRPQA